MSIRKFPLSSALAITNPYIGLATLEELLEILSHLTGKEVQKIDLPSLISRYYSVVLAQHPALEKATSKESTKKYYEIVADDSSKAAIKIRWCDWLAHESGYGLGLDLEIQQMPLALLENHERL